MSNEISLTELLNRDIEEYNRVSSMLSKSVHDINNPLAVFIGQVSIIELLQQRGQLDTDKMEKILDKFKTSSETLKDRIGLLRNFYKVPINDPMFSMLENSMSSACYMFENEAYQLGITMNVEHLQDVHVDISPNEIFIIVKHLVQNALEALKSVKKEGGQINVKAKRLDDDSIEISVSDDGPGLVCAPDLAYELGYTTKADKTGGTGLAIINKILAKKGRELTYTNDGGARFSFKVKEVAAEQ